MAKIYKKTVRKDRKGWVQISLYLKPKLHTDLIKYVNEITPEDERVNVAGVIRKVLRRAINAHYKKKGAKNEPGGSES